MSVRRGKVRQQPGALRDTGAPPRAHNTNSEIPPESLRRHADDEMTSTNTFASPFPHAAASTQEQGMRGMREPAARRPTAADELRLQQRRAFFSKGRQQGIQHTTTTKIEIDSRPQVAAPRRMRAHQNRTSIDMHTHCKKRRPAVLKLIHTILQVPCAIARITRLEWRPSFSSRLNYSYKAVQRLGKILPKKGSCSETISIHTGREKNAES